MPIAFDRVRFADNLEPRAPCVLVVDTSPSMGSEGLREADRVIASLVDQWAADPEAARSMELAIVISSPALVARGFTMVDSFTAPTLWPSDSAPLATSIGLAIDISEARKQAIRAAGLLLYRPSIVILTAARSAHRWHAVAERIRTGHDDRAFHTVAVGIEGADFDLLTELTVVPPRPAAGLRLRPLLPWVG